jgi:cell division septation protein DedD
MKMIKFLIVAPALIALFAGCAKKQRQTDSEFTQSPVVNETKQSQDIFDEFYKEENGASNSRNGYGTKQSNSDSQSKSASAYSPGFSESGSIVIQISTLHSQKMADNLASRFNAKGYPSYVVTVQNPTPALEGSYYRVRIGTFKGITAAREFGENILKTEGYEYWIDNKSNDNIGIEGNGLGESGKNSYANPYNQINQVQTSSQPASESTISPAVTKPTTPQNNGVKPVSQQPDSSSTTGNSGKNEWGD